MDEETPCSVTVAGETCTIAVAGRFDFRRFGDFRQATAKALAPRQPRVSTFVVDLAATVYLDSSALGMLLSFNDAVRLRGGQVVLANAGGTVRKILDIAHFHILFTLT